MRKRGDRLGKVGADRVDLPLTGASGSYSEAELTRGSAKHESESFMIRILTSALVLSILAPAALAGQGGDKGKKPDRTIEILREDGKIVFREKDKPRGKGKPRAVGVVVGETIRWVNRDTEPHTLKSVAKVDDKPVFDSKAIRPGEHKDVVFNIDMYRGVGGRPARYVSLKYRSDDKADREGELTFMSAARR